MTANKKILTCLLIGANCLLAAALIVSTVSLPGAHAQAGRGGSDYLAVTAKAAGRNSDVLFLFDVPNQRLHAFYPGLPQRNEIARSEARDIKKDFGKP